MQLLDGGRVVLHVQINQPVVGAHVPSALAHHENCRRLAPAGIAAGRLARGQGGHQARSQVALCGLERSSHSVNYLRACQEVTLHRIVIARLAAGPWEGLGARVGRRLAPCRDDADLALLAQGIVGQQSLDGLLRTKARRQQSQPLCSVKDVTAGLGRQRSNIGARVGHDGADSEVLGLDADAKVTGGWIAGDDGEGGDVTIVCDRSGGKQQERKHRQPPEGADRSDRNRRDLFGGPGDNMGHWFCSLRQQHCRGQPRRFMVAEWCFDFESVRNSRPARGRPPSDK